MNTEEKLENVLVQFFLFVAKKESDYVAKEVYKNNFTKSEENFKTTWSQIFRYCTLFYPFY